jgi:glycosyltransferase involved in cell wall biosynthesis
VGRDSSHPLQVLVLIDSLRLGGAERIAVELACGLDRRRFDPHVVATRGSGPLERLLLEAEVAHTLLARSHRGSLPAHARMHRIARDCDLIHSHKFGSNVWGALAARIHGLPLIAHEHNWSGAPSRLRSLWDKRWVAPAAERILCVSDSVRQSMLREGISGAKLQVLHNGVRMGEAWTREAARRRLRLDDREFVVGVVADLRLEKRHDLLVEAFAMLAQRGRVARLCVVGDGPCATDLRALASRLGIGDRIQWAGEDEEAPRLAAAFDASVLCSDWEGLPLACLEALDAGVPVIASAVGGVPQLLGGGAGMLIEPGSASQLAAAITATMDRSPHVRALAAEGQRRVRTRYDLRLMVQRIEEIYEDVSRRRPVGRTARKAERRVLTGARARQRALSAEASSR